MESFKTTSEKDQVNKTPPRIAGYMGKLFGALVCGAVVALLIWRGSSFVATGFCLLFAIAFLLTSGPMLFVLFAIESSIDQLWFIPVINISGTAISFVAIFGVTVFVLEGFYIFSRRVNVFRFDITTPLLLFAFISVVAVFSAPPFFRVQAGGDFLRIFSGALLLYMTATVVTTRYKLDLLLHIYLVSLVVPLSLALAQAFYLLPEVTKVYFIDGHMRLAGLYAHPHHLAKHIILNVPILMFLMAHARQYFAKMVYGIILLCLIPFLYLTYCRTEWVIFAMQLALWLALKRRWLALGGFLLLLVAFSWFNPFLREMLYTQPLQTGLSGRLSGEIRLWPLLLRRFLAASFYRKMFGFGFQSVQSITAAVLGRELHAHNFVLSVLMDTGIVGLSVALWLLWRIFRNVRQFVAGSSDKYFADFARLGLIQLTSFALLGVTQSVINVPSYMWYWWGLMGVILGKTVLEQRSRSPAGAASATARC